MQTLTMSAQPLQDIERVSYPGQSPLRKQFRPGYEWAMNDLPALADEDPALIIKTDYAKKTMERLSRQLSGESWIADKLMHPETFERTIIGIEQPNGKEGSEIVVAQWGEGFSSPVHGHASGYMFEGIIKGSVVVRQFRRVDDQSNVVRPVRMDKVGPGTFVSRYSKHREDRSVLIHNFTALETTSSLHFLPEHTRDGRGNRFEVEYFEDVHGLTFKDVLPTTGKDAMYARIGDVLLVRSSNVPYFDDHYIVITGAPVMKEHGLRPQDVAIPAPHATILDFYAESSYNGLTLLKLRDEVAQRFREFHGITLGNGQIIMP